MAKVKRRFKTDANGQVPRSCQLEPLTQYMVAPKTRPAAGPIETRDKVISWITDCVLGDLRTLRAGIEARNRHDGQVVVDRLSGANYLLAAGCCMALEYFSRIYCGKDDALSNVRRYVKDFLVPINDRYGEVCDLVWRSFHNGIIHGSWPQTICLKGEESKRIVVGVGVDEDDPHLAPLLDDNRDTLVVNAVRFLGDLERSVDEGFARWLRECKDDSALERAGPRLLEISPRDKNTRRQFNLVIKWNSEEKGSG